VTTDLLETLAGPYLARPGDRGAAEWEGLLAEAYAYVDAITP
jgi:hypothetical protein